MSFDLQTSLNDFKSQYCAGTIKNHDSTSFPIETKFRSLSASIERWKNVIFDSNFLTLDGIQHLRDRQVKVLGGLSDPRSNLHFVASHLHAVNYHCIVSDHEISEQSINMVRDLLHDQIQNLPEEKFSCEKQDLIVIADNIPLLAKLSRQFLEAVVKNRVYTSNAMVDCGCLTGFWKWLDEN